MIIQVDHIWYLTSFILCICFVLYEEFKKRPDDRTPLFGRIFYCIVIIMGSMVIAIGIAAGLNAAGITTNMAGKW